VHLLWSKYHTNGQVPGEVRKCSLWWKSILRLLNMYKGMEQAHLGSRKYILFWSVMWNGRILQHSYFQLHSFAISGNIIVKVFMEKEEPHDDLLA
jgi:hypothetical protein